MANSNFFEELLSRANSIWEKDTQNIFDKVNKPTNKSIMSRVLFFLLTHNDDFLKNIIYRYEDNIRAGIQGKIQIRPNSQCEKLMHNCRADIFIECADENRQFIVVIDNKIDTFDDDQMCICQNYIDKYYKDEYQKVLISLKSDLHCDTYSDKKESVYRVIQYSDLSKMIEKSVQDKEGYSFFEFDTYINKYFIEVRKQMKLVEQSYFYNYNQINSVAQKCDIIKKHIKDELYNTIKGTLISKNNNIVIYQRKNESSIQVNDIDWCVKDKYSFYVESATINDDLSNIYVQKVVKISDANLKVVDYKIQDKKDRVYYIYEKEKFIYNSEFLSSEWLEELKDFCISKIQQFYDSMSTTIANFKMFNQIE